MKSFLSLLLCSLSAMIAPSEIQLMAAENASPIVIAHRGASGYLPEHTLEAYTLAHAQGANYIEQDLVLTKDNELICLHDIHLEATTNVETAFPDRKRSDGHWYAIDFTLEEIRSLENHERLPNRFPRNRSSFSVPTFSEAIELIQGLDKTLNRHTGLYPELKQPEFHLKAGQPIEPVFVATLKAHGLWHHEAKIFVQCFEWDCLRRLKEEHEIPLPQVFLLGGSRSDLDWVTDEKLAELRSTIAGIGPSKRLIESHPALVTAAHRYGLVVHPYTFRADDHFPNNNYPTFDAELKQFLGMWKVDGLFTDFPDLARQHIDER